MLNLKSKLIAVLKELKSNYLAMAIKADFEAEGTTVAELAFLKELVDKANLKLFLKIGGCEAVFDLQLAKMFGANGVIVPVVESLFALKKFKQAFERVFGLNCFSVERILNAETKTCVKNIEEILNYGRGFLSSVNVGRVDLADSLNLGRKEIDNLEVMRNCSIVFNQAKKLNFEVGLGGGLSEKSFLFFQKIPFDRFETRKVVFKYSCSSSSEFRKALIVATKFELYCLEFKKEYFKSLAFEDQERLQMLEQRLANL